MKGNVIKISTFVILITLLTACNSDKEEKVQENNIITNQQDLFNQLEITSIDYTDYSDNDSSSQKYEYTESEKEYSKNIRTDITINEEELESIDPSTYSWYTMIDTYISSYEGHQLIVYALLKYYDNQVPYNFSCDTVNDIVEMPSGQLFKMQVHSDNPDEPILYFTFNLNENIIQVN